MPRAIFQGFKKSLKSMPQTIVQDESIRSFRYKIKDLVAQDWDRKVGVIGTSKANQTATICRMTN